MTESLNMTQGAWARIIPFLRPLEPLLQDPEITDIMVNGERGVFFEKCGQIEQVSGVVIKEQALQVAARNIARALGDDVNEETPILDSRLPDGSRVAIVLASVSVTGTSLAIRKFQNRRYTAEELVRVGTLTTQVLALLSQAVREHQSILISGGTGTGKTTLLNALAAFIPADERVVVIDDTSEIHLQCPNLVRLEARKPQPELPAVTIRDLLKATLRLRPDRILLGEVRQGEAFDLLQALNTGHEGGLSTIHANSAPQALTRLATCALMSGIELPHQTIRSNIADAFQLLVHLARREGKRCVTQVAQIKRYSSRDDRYDLETLYAD